MLSRRPSRRFLAVALTVHVLIGAWIVRGARAHPALHWMDFYTFEDITSFADAWSFFAELRTGIPPLLAALEVTEHLLTGDAWLTDVVLYRVGLVLAFALPVVAFRRSTLQVLCAFAVSLLFLASARVVGAGNAQLYDPLTPLLLMGGLFALDVARHRPRHALPLAVVAGAALALAELCRPFILVLLPLLAAWGWLVLREQPRRTRVAFLLPILVLSGGWHAKLWIAHDGQLLWSNHGGYNLYRAWENRVEEWPAFVGQRGWQIDPRPLVPPAIEGSGRWYGFHWNTQRHADRSRALTRAWLGHVVREPLDSARFAALRMGVLLLPKTHVGKSASLRWLRRPYRIGVRISSILLLAGLGVLLYRLARHRLAQLLQLETPWILTTWSLVFFLAVGERGEEARFVISVLPFLAALPWPAPVASPRRAGPAERVAPPERAGPAGSLTPPG